MRYREDVLVLNNNRNNENFRHAACGNMDGWGGEIGGLFPVVVYWQFMHDTHHLMAYTEVICLHGCK